MCDLARDRGRARASLGDVLGGAHTREEECLDGSTELPIPDPSHRIVSFFLGYSTPSVRCMVILSTCLLQKQIWNCLSMCLIQDAMARKQNTFQYPWDDLSAYAFLHFALLRQVLSRVMLSINLSLVLVALSGLKSSSSQICWLFWWKNLSNSPCCEICWSSLTSGSFI